MSLTTDPSDPRLKRNESGMNEVYLILSDEERAKGFVRPVRTSYIHDACGTVTTMGIGLAETYARQPDFYGATYCMACGKHLPVSEFRWAHDDEQDRVGSLRAVLVSGSTILADAAIQLAVCPACGVVQRFAYGRVNSCPVCNAEFEYKDEELRVVSVVGISGVSRDQQNFPKGDGDTRKL